MLRPICARSLEARRSTGAPRGSFLAWTKQDAKVRTSLAVGIAARDPTHHPSGLRAESAFKAVAELLKIAAIIPPTPSKPSVWSAQNPLFFKKPIKIDSYRSAPLLRTFADVFINAEQITMNMNFFADSILNQDEIRTLSGDEIAQISGGGGSDFPVIPR